MKIAVIAGSAANKTWLAGKLSPALECAWVDEVAELLKHRDAALFMDLGFVRERSRIEMLSRLLPAPVIIHSPLHTLEETGHSFIRINAWPGMLERKVHELVIDGDAPPSLDQLYEALGHSYRKAPDVTGMISGRILATIVNEAYYTLQEQVSTKGEIDTAMKLGTNYPLGPFEWSERIGLLNIYDLLNKLAGTDSRYVPAAALKAAVEN